MKIPHDWSMTYTGKKFDPLNPVMADIDIRDIAHALSLKCRYTGHCREFYSVAQHSVLLSRVSIHPFEALMHDASEAYLPDVARPVKPRLIGFKEIEDNLLKMIFKKYSLIYPISRETKELDTRICISEGYWLFDDISDWKILETHKPLPIYVTPWSWKKSKIMFMERFLELFRHEGS